MRRVLLPAALALTVATGALSMSRDGEFPHEEHAGLFPTCLGCHSGIPTGNEGAYYSVAVSDCARCHDGQREERVEWTGPTRTASNLVFVHAQHADAVRAEGDEALACATCHGPAGAGEPRMAVGRADPATCTECHAHEVPEHLAPAAACETCHRPLVEARGLDEGRIGAFPEPASHAEGAFLFDHGAMAGAPDASCAVCHARPSCTRCHLDAERSPEIQALEPDDRVARLVAGVPGEWPEPDDHARIDWVFEHGAELRAGAQACATCHAEASCRTCHGDATIPEIAALPDVEPGGPEGVFIARTRPPGHLPDFATRHGSAAAANLPSCTSCHSETQCTDCHSSSGRTPDGFAPGGAGMMPRPLAAAAPTGEPGPIAPAGASAAYRHLAPANTPSEGRPGYHPDNFMLRHGAEAFSVQTVCSDCHSTEAFCRDCHRSTGMSINADGGAGGAFHDAQPNWFFEHGRAARQGMESCASCHQQTSCLRCHSAQFGLRINPHGPGFDPDRVAARSTIACGVCHTADQIPPP